jgi:hypothetical protein
MRSPTIIPLLVLLALSSISAAASPAADPDAAMLDQIERALAQRPSNLDTARGLLAELTDDPRWSRRRFDLTLRFALQEIASSPGPAMDGLWQAHHNRLAGRTAAATLAPATLETLDALLATLPGSSLSPKRLLTDMQELPLDPASRHLITLRAQAYDITTQAKARLLTPQEPPQVVAVDSVLQQQA